MTSFMIPEPAGDDLAPARDVPAPRRPRQKPMDRVAAAEAAVAAAGTSVEAAAVYVPPPGLSAAIDDAKLACASFHYNPPQTLLTTPNWCLTAGGPGTLTLMATNRQGDVFTCALTADADGMWTRQGSGTTYPRLRAAVVAALRSFGAGLSGKVEAFPTVPAEGYELVTDGALPSERLPSPELHAANLQQWRSLASRLPGQPVWVLALPVLAPPHVHLSLLQAGTGDDVTELVLGLHPASGCWFLADATGAWVRVAFSLACLVRTVTA